MDRVRIIASLFIALVSAAAIWFFSMPITGFLEPFDAPTLYYPVTMFAAGILAALPAPRYWWVAFMGVFLGEKIYISIMLPDGLVWLAFSIYIGVLTLTWLPSAIGAFLVYLVSKWRSAQ